MQDQYTGLAGTFIVDPETQERIPIEQYEDKNSLKEVDLTPFLKETNTEES